MISKKLVSSLLLLGMSLNNCSAKDNSKLSILKNAGFTIGGVAAGVLGTLVINKILNSETTIKNKEQKNIKSKIINSNNKSEKSEEKFEINKSLFMVMFDFINDKTYVKAVDKSFDNEELITEISEYVNYTEINNEFFKNLDIKREEKYSGNGFHEKLKSLSKKRYESVYHHGNDYENFINSIGGHGKLFCEICSIKGSDKLFWWYGYKDYKFHVGEPGYYYGGQGDGGFFWGIWQIYVVNYVERQLNKEFINSPYDEDLMNVHLSKLSNRADNIEKEFRKDEKK